MKQRKFFQYFTQRLKLSLRSVRSSQEVWHIFTNRAKLIIWTIALSLLLFCGAFFAIAYTPIADYIPGYLGAESRDRLISSIAKLDSLEREVQLWELYSSDLRDILEGKELPARYLGSDTISSQAVGGISKRSDADSLFRLSVEQRKLREELDGVRAEISFEMIAPIAGSVTSGFSSGSNPLGVEVLPSGSSVVLAVLDGTVILSQWTPEDGYITVVQHAASMVSVYKGMQGVLLDMGTRVKAGQGLGVIELNSSAPTPFIFELWSAGNAIDPESYITFEP